MDVPGRPVVVVPCARHWGRAAGKQRARRIVREPMRVPGGRDVRQTLAIVGNTAGNTAGRGALCVNPELHVL